MTREIEAIVAADRAAQRSVRALSGRLDAVAREEAERLARERAAADAEEHARLDADVATLQRDGAARLASAAAARAAERARRRDLAAGEVDRAVAAYVAVVKGGAR